METIQDLLMNEHILNFHAGVQALPPWLGSNLKVILGAGDYDQDGELNVQTFSMFDVFFCFPLDDRGSLRRNIEYLLAHYYHQKVICFIDIENPKQLNQFCKLFANRVELVDGFGGHTPHLPLDCIARVLQMGGKAVNIYERGGEINYDENELQKICYKSSQSLTLEDANILRGLFQFFTKRGKASLSTLNNNQNWEDILFGYTQCLLRHALKLAETSPIQVNWAIFSDKDTRKKFQYARQLLAVLLTIDRLPRGIQGVFMENKRIWNNRIFDELVLTKVSEGGRRKRTLRKMRKSRRSNNF